ncbi:MAG: 23S rRNA (guanosine(2251)-2'-O)-methyltransferase RlmB [Candidatus Paceibacteria bacterium]
MRPKRNPGASRDKVYIYGKHALMEALVSTPRIIKKVFLSHEAADKELVQLLNENSIPHVPLATGKGKEMVGRDATHQGVIAIMDPSALLSSFEDFIQTIDLAKNPAIAILGEIHDPHNVGAIIRSAAAFGFSAVLIPEHHQAGVTGVVVKSSAGMAFRIPLVSIGNINNTIKILKEKGFWIYGLAMGGKRMLGIEKFDTPSAFIVGNEGAGIREKTLEACDAVISIPMHKRTESLNAAVSAAVVFYEWSKKHPEAL